MAELTGSEILAKCLKKEGVEDLFFIMGGPMLLAEATCVQEGIRMIDVRHEQAAAFACQAYSRLLQKPSVCMAASGPGVTNLVTGVANALVDCCPVVAIGGASPISQFGRQVFQEIDQMAIMRGVVKYADRIHNLKRIPQQVNFAFQKAMSGKPGPVYLDFPGDILYQKIDEDQVDWSFAGRPLLDARPLGNPAQVAKLVDALAKAKQPILVSGSGVIWSQAWPEMHALVDKIGIPFYTTPQGRGVVPDDHPCSYMTMRSSAFRDADLIVVLGTRMNYIIGHAAPPRFGGNATIARIDIDPDEIATAARFVDIPRRLDPPARQERGDAHHRRRRHPGRRGAGHLRTDLRPELRGARHHADRAPPDHRALQDGELAGTLLGPPARGETGAAARPAHRRGAGGLARSRDRCDRRAARGQHRRLNDTQEGDLSWRNSPARKSWPNA